MNTEIVSDSLFIDTGDTCREEVSVCVWAHVRACVHACVRACMHVCVCLCVSACMDANVCFFDMCACMRNGKSEIGMKGERVSY